MKQNVKADVAPAECGQQLHIERDGEECYVTASNALERLCTMSRPSARQRLQDAQRLVQCCNAHDQLVSALLEIAEPGPVEGYGSADALRLRLVGTQTIARAALAQAQKVQL